MRVMISMVIIHKPEKLKPETLSALIRAAEVARKTYGKEGLT